MGQTVPTSVWRIADQPTAGHELAVGILTRARYERTRGVAQQAARAARALHLSSPERRLLLAAAWVHDLGAPEGGGDALDAALTAARALRRAGQETCARIVAHRANMAAAASIAGRAPIAREFPPPRGADARVLMCLDIALLTTRADGAPGSPRDAISDLARVHGPGSAPVRALVALVAGFADDPAARRVVESLARRASAGAITP